MSRNHDAARPAPGARARARDLGLRLGLLPTGPLNAITDVAGVRVGHATVRHGQPPGGPGLGPARTGVSAIWPGEGIGQVGYPAGMHVLNGFGELTGAEVVREIGGIATPIVLTNTLGVGVAYDAVARYLIDRFPALMSAGDLVTPVVGECNDAYLNDAIGLHVRAEHVWAALDQAAGGPVAEGDVGAGTGMACFSFKGGIGTASRRLPASLGGHTVGALALANFGNRAYLTIGGTAVGQACPDPRWQGQAFPPDPGSCILVLATDAPLSALQLRRLAGRGPLGLARLGSYGSNGSGEIALAFSTGYTVPFGGRSLAVELVSDWAIDPLFAAAVEATEEAVVNCLCQAHTTTGLRGRTVEAMPLDWIAAG
ncbi:MAG: P1 family peptidase [Bifidobacteriaceae bacterium]|jgi:D-aminopeptidase|nr:P1 family peptidase [Bifidobacteriaceae bacterium]